MGYREVYKILLTYGVKCSENSIRAYYGAYKKGFKHYVDYMDYLARKKGFKDRSSLHQEVKIQDDFQKHSDIFRDIEEYKLYIRDDNFRDVYHPNGREINWDNPFITTPSLYSTVINPEYGGDGINNQEDIEYIHRGIEILEQLGRI